MKGDIKFRHLWLFQLFADFAALCLAYYITYFFRFHSDVGERFFTLVNRTAGVRDTGAIVGPFSSFYMVSAPRIILIMVLTLSFLYALFNLYPGRRFIMRRPIAWNVLQGNIAALAIFYTYFYLSRNTFHPRSYFVTVIFFNVVLCILFRSWMGGFLNYLRTRYSVDKHTAIVVGANDEADYIKSLLEVLHPHGLELVGRVDVEKDMSFEELLKKTQELAQQKKVDMLFVADKEHSINEIMLFMELADKMKLSVKILSDKMNVLHVQAKMPTDRIHGVPLVHFDSPRYEGVRASATNMISKTVALILIVLLLPVMLIAALLIKLTSAGPVLFVQERIGVNRKPFEMYKFRTMYDRAEETQAQLEEFNETNGVFKIKKDPRVTPVGRFLRRFSIDELPQLFNVIKGDMRIVGPRPLPQRDFENYYEDWHYSRHAGQPGLTCLWQISGRSDIDFHDMCLLDVYYLRNRSWILDIKIFIRTIWVVLFGRGAY
ncbi:hypothetical protein BVX97_05930 [bacterium E08(2017)]|nr:hypothetical protein BVX97_05930 [bacterium E08(2017)]